MAAVFEIKGKTLIKTGATVLGLTNADELPSWEEIKHELGIHTNESGPEMYAKLIQLGITAIIRANLNWFDKAQINTLRVQTGGSDAGDIGTMGGDVFTFPITIEGTKSGSKSYTFPVCRFIEPIADTQWGHKDNMMGLVFGAQPDPTALSTVTTPLYTEGTVS